MNNGPVEIVASKTSRIPIYNGKHHGKDSFMLAWYADGQRKRERFYSLEEARQRAREVIKELSSGTAHAATFTPAQAALIAEVTQQLREINVKLSVAVREYAEAHRILAGSGTVVDAAIAFARDAARRRLPRKSVSEVVDEFLASIKSTGLSQRYLLDCKSRLRRAAGAFQMNIGDVATGDIEFWLAKGNRSPRSFNNDRNALVTLFNFAKRRGSLPRDIETAAELVSKRKDVGGEIQILTPEMFANLLSQTPETFIPYVALGGLAGLRTAEIVRLDWREVDFAQGHILVTAQKSKTASRRLAPLCESLKQWLLPLAKAGGKVMPFADEQSMMNRWTKVKAGMKNVHVPTNALRHSFCSYRLALLEDAAKVSLEMGNSPAKVFRNYRQLVTKAQAETWFAISPVASGEILKIA
jgi:integrase